MKFFNAILTIVLLVFVSACGPRPPSARGATLEAAANAVLPRTTNSAFRLYSSKATPFGTALIYTTADPDRSSTTYVGYVLAEQRGTSWITTDIAIAQSYPPGASARTVHFGAHMFDRDGTVFAVFGLARTPSVAEVEVKFKSSTTLRDAPAADGVFVLMEKGATGLCNLRTLDAQGMVLEEINVDATGVCAN